jgi:tetratricopeptide (TPR) repeat protein
VCQGRTDEAVAWTRRGRELDPIVVPAASLGWILFQSHRSEEALKELRGEVALAPARARALWTLGFALIAADQAARAVPVLEETLSLTNDSPAAAGVLIRAYAHAGRRDDGVRLVRRLEERRKTEYVPAGAFVNAYLGLDEPEQAFAWLEQAFKEQSNILQYLKVHPYFDPIRSDPRFADLLHRVGLDTDR